jgi:hypothetical protein
MGVFGFPPSPGSLAVRPGPRADGPRLRRHGAGWAARCPASWWIIPNSPASVAHGHPDATTRTGTDSTGMNLPMLLKNVAR